MSAKPTLANPPLRIFGLDPGLAHTGWGVLEQSGSRLRAIAYGCVVTGPETEISLRLHQIFSEVSAAIERYAAREFAIETVYHKGNDRSAIATAEARGAALVAAGEAGLKVGEYAPAKIKSAVCGNGRADKRQVQFMVARLLGLQQEIKPDHCADALAAAICHAHLRHAHDLLEPPQPSAGPH
ncbi:MAG: crossover junction endodeoxyribonuclease RuvC [Coriobacteriales bacterium]|jgi:crossover junction endodeoxyribonuclease RuvC|nr:crossover junction endodeoxyribonuclease RuvC [Coriobacteriales bacterium]